MRRALLAYVLVLAAACASTTRLEGTIGPVSWHVKDIEVVKREIAGRDTDVYIAKLVLKELRGSRIVFTRYERSVSDLRMARSAPPISSGRWVLPANGELALTLAQSLACPPIPSGCGSPYATSAPEFDIRLIGTDAQGQPVVVSIDVRLPPAQMRVRDQ